MARPSLRLWVLLVAGVPLIGLAFLMGVGWLLPAEHIAASRAEFPVPPDTLWAVVTDFARMPTWRSDVQRVERLPDKDGHPVWLEVGTSGSLPFEVTLWEPPHRLRTEIADATLPFGGNWTYEIEARGEASRLQITERGTISNPIFRSLARYVFGYHSTLDDYLRSLGTRWSQEVEPIHLSAEG